MTGEARKPIHERDRRNVELVRRHRAGDPTAAAELLELNEPMVTAVVKRCRIRAGISLHDPCLDDAYQAGRMGLLHALEKYDIERASFGTYAMWWVRQRVIRFFAEDTLIHVPVHVLCDSKHHTTRTQDQARQALAFRPSGRDASWREDYRWTMESIPSREGEIDLDVQFESERLYAALGRISERQALVVRLRFGLAGEPVHTYPQIAQRLGVSKQRVTQLLDMGLKRIRQQLQRPARPVEAIVVV